MLYHKTKKIFIIIIVLCTAIAFLVFSLSMSASDDSIGKNVGRDTISTPSAPDIVSADAITQIDLSDCYTELYDIDGNIVSTSRDALTADTIPSGYTMRYYRADESAFAIEKNQQISIIAQQDSSYNYGWRCGYGSVTLGEANSQALSGSGLCNETDSYSFLYRIRPTMPSALPPARLNTTKTKRAASAATK